MLTSERQTKAGTIERNIHVEITNVGIRVTISEFRQPKAKETNLADSSTTYLLRRIPSHLGGVGVEVEKLGADGEVYHALLNGPHGHTCSCPWGTYKPNAKPCRHVAAALEAVKCGALLVPQD